MRVSRKTSRFLEISANLAIVIVAVVVVGNFVWTRTRPKQNISAPSVGNVVSLAGVNWRDNGRTLLMVLQKGCVYCEASAPFYRKLHDERKGEQPRMLAVIPGDQVDTAHYLSERGIPTDGVINASLAEVNVSGTPTLLLIDQTGRVKNVWVGKLDENREKEVMQRAFELH